MSPATSEVSTRSWTSVSIRREPVSPRTAIGSAGSSSSAQHAGADGVVDVVVDVGDAVDQPHDPALERPRHRRAARVADDAVAHVVGQVQAAPTTRPLRALEHVHDPQRVLVVAEAAAEALGQRPVEDVLADVAERRVAEVVPEADRLDEVLVEPERPRDRARDLGDLDRVGQPRAEVVALRRDEHLGLVLEPPERLAVDDPVAVALQRRAQAAVVLGHPPAGRPRARRERREVLGLPRLPAPRQGRCDGAGMGVRIHARPILASRVARPAAV